MEIRTQKVIMEDGELGRKILGFENIKGPRDLPQIYLRSGVSVTYFDRSNLEASDKITVRTSTGYNYVLVQVATYAQSHLDLVIKWMDYAKVRLEFIQGCQKIVQRDWHGEETIII